MNLMVFGKNKVSSIVFDHSIAKNTLLCCIVAIATAYSAQLRIVLPWTPVPITLQTFVVLSSGMFLGKRWGTISQLLYLFLSIAGLPLFTGMASGWAVIAGARGGYLLGFPIASFFVGYALEKMRKTNYSKLLLVFSFSNFAIIHGMGFLNLFFWFWNAHGEIPNIFSLLMMGFIPFILGDLIKIALLATITKATTVKKGRSDAP
jgi:biotin transport system substrate-specific component